MKTLIEIKGGEGQPDFSLQGTDDGEWTIYRVRTRTEGKKCGRSNTREALGYYGRLDQALTALLNLRLASSGATSFRELGGIIADFRKLVKETLTINAEV